MNALLAQGVPANTVQVYVLDADGRRLQEVSVHSEAGALRGGLIGALVGAIGGLILWIVVRMGLFGSSVGELVLDSLAGGLAAAAAFGASAGVPLGVLLGTGRWQGADEISDRQFREHGATVVVESAAKAEVARQILESSGADSVSTPGS